VTIAKIAAALFFIALNFYAYNNFANEDIVPPRVLFEEFPDQIGTWRCGHRESMDEDIINNLGVTDYIICNFYDGSSSDLVGLYIGYHEKQQRSDSGKTTLIHPPEHCLPGAGWDIIESDIIDVDYGIPGQAKRVVIAKGRARQLVYFWYQSRGRVIANDIERIRYMFQDRATRGRTDGALMRFTIPIDRDGIEKADATFDRFARTMLAEVGPFLPN
jgi:EpsI family protein